MSINRIFVTSDTHISHERIIEYCNRPFNSVVDMDQALFNSWNETVNDSDIVLHMGDFSIKSKPEALVAPVRAKIEALKGRKVLVRGNHDKDKMVKWLESLGWVVVHNIEIKNMIMFAHKYMDHTEEYGKFGRYLLHGHAHGTLGPNTDLRIDCGVDILGFKPTDIHSLISEEAYSVVSSVVADLIADKNGCLGVIFNTVVMCGEMYGDHPQYCSKRCMNAATK